MVVLDRDPLAASPKDLMQTRVLRTIVNGETVYLARGNESGNPEVGQITDDGSFAS